MLSSTARKREGEGHVFHGQNTVSGYAKVYQGDFYYEVNESQLTEEQKCIQSFYTGKSYQKYKDINPLRAENTCLWVLEHPRFVSWRTDPAEALLWVSADPGCGKSVLSRSLVDLDLKQEEVTVFYFFFKDNDDQDNLCEALCALIHQLLVSKPQLVHHAMSTWKHYGTGLRQEAAKMWSILLSALNDSDAGRFRREETSNATKAKAKFLVTSRPYDNVQRWFSEITSDLPQIRLSGENENEQINKEIDIVITMKVLELGKEFDLTESHQKSLRARLVGMQHRTYLWLHLAMEEIRGAYELSFNPEEVEIKSLSRDINEAYETILRKFDNEVQMKNARTVLTIILGARRPLSLSEMASALSASTAHERSSVKLLEVHASRLQKSIRGWCGLFVFIQHDKLFLIHQTAREFLLSGTGAYAPEDTGIWQHSFHLHTLDHIMANICTTYLSLAPKSPFYAVWKSLILSDRNYEEEYIDLGVYTILEGDHDYMMGKPFQQKHKPQYSGHVHNQQNNPWSFLECCLDEWASHLNDQNLEADARLLERFLDLCDPNMSDRFIRHLAHFDERGGYRIVSEEDYINEAFLKIARAGQFRLLCTFHARFKCDVHYTDLWERSALLLAASEGHESITEWLLGKGVFVDSRDDFERTALLYAAKNGSTSIFQLLVQNGASVDAVDNHGETALMLAVQYTEFEMVQFLVENIDDVEAANSDGETALILAAEIGRLDVVQLLLNSGAKLEVSNSMGQTALIKAMDQLDQDMVKVLIDNGACIEAADSSQLTPLLIAVEYQWYEIARILIKAGAQLDVVDEEGRTPLHIALDFAFQMLDDWNNALSGAPTNESNERLHSRVASLERVIQLLQQWP